MILGPGIAIFLALIWRNDSDYLLFRPNPSWILEWAGWNIKAAATGSLSKNCLAHIINLLIFHIRFGIARGRQYISLCREALLNITHRTPAHLKIIPSISVAQLISPVGAYPILQWVVPMSRNWHPCLTLRFEETPVWHLSRSSLEHTGCFFL